MIFRKRIIVGILQVIIASFPFIAVAQELKPQIINGMFKPDSNSLKQYKCPEWFQDAKFGIWSHWGPQSVPMFGDWYARRMYIEGSKVYNYHLKTYGHPSKFGYKDIIALWKAEKWNPDKLMDLYVKVGAKYFVSMGAHHDGFDLWNSKHNPWNAYTMGPKRDIVGEWATAARKRGLRFGISEHFARAYNWMGLSHGSDKEGNYAGVPYDGNDPKYADLYFPPKLDDNGDRYPVKPPTWWQKKWFDRMEDAIINYQPDFLYSDGAIPMGNTGRLLLSDFYNQNIQWHKGKLEAVYTFKNVGADWGEYIEGAGVHDEEQSILPEIKKDPWQTDTSLSNWFYDANFKNKENGQMYYSAGRIVRLLSDIVSKNGNLLLNVTQLPDGSIEPEAITILEQLGKWMKINGEAIFATRPWFTYGEGPSTNIKDDIKNELFNINKFQYTEKDFRFTRTKDRKNLFVIGLIWPQDPNITIKTLVNENVAISDIKLLGYDKKITWKQTKDGLQITLPQTKPSDLAYALKITVSHLRL
ncbi:alpha-L-fucosidase [Arcicella rosea]|uniref:alpha-L-fucosidase n=1 Tax=Arcicella rosea TaxID=502909 RepID=A0A841EP95_9BACT|nr:alpha-L-fucosidase [Arcicella rosea]MBB6002548.1 alpha-L-fucosidase [Arcicella rosea]